MEKQGTFDVRKMLAYPMVTMILFGSPQHVFGADIGGDWVFLSATVGFVDTQYVVPTSAKFRQYLEDIRPANKTVVTQLAAEGALIELEVTALRRKKQ